LLLGQALAAFLIPILVTAFFFSARTSRRNIVFWSNISILLLGITLVTMNAYLEIKRKLAPHDIIPNGTLISFTVVTASIPAMVEFILLLRILAVYPYNATPVSKYVEMLSFPMMIKIVRLANIIYFLTRYKEINESFPLNAGHFALKRLRNPDFEWSLAVLDSFHTSTIFFSKLNTTARKVKLQQTPLTLSQKIRASLWTSFNKYALPTFFTLAMSVVYLVGPKEHSVIIYLVTINCFISAITVVFAAIWVTGSCFSGGI